MTDEMLALANENKRSAGATNVEFLKGEIEQIPLPDNSVDVIISNCVINLSADKGAGAARSVPRAQAGRTVRGVRRRRARRSAARRCGATWSCGSAASPARSRRWSTATCSPTPAFVASTIEPTRVYKAEDAAAFLAGQRPRSGDVRGADRRQVHERVRARGEADAQRKGARAMPRGSRDVLRTGLLLMTTANGHEPRVATCNPRRATDDGSRARRGAADEQRSCRSTACAEALHGFVVAESEATIVGVVGPRDLRRSLRAAALDGRAPTWRGRGRRRDSSSSESSPRRRRAAFDALYLLTTTAEAYFPSFGFATTTRDSVPARSRATAEFQRRVSGVGDGDVRSRLTSTASQHASYALISDIHANLPALEAVLADIARAATSTRPITSAISSATRRGRTKWSRASPSAAIPGVAGNYDSTVATDYKHCGCRYEDPQQEELSHLSYEWTRAHVTRGDEARTRRAAVPHRPSARSADICRARR